VRSAAAQFRHLAFRLSVCRRLTSRSHGGLGTDRTDPAGQSEPQKLTNEEVQTLLQDRSTVYQVEPAGVMAYAEFMVKTGMLKTKPDSWKDVFFPYVYEKGGN
jgi:hypothetical protein